MSVVHYLCEQMVEDLVARGRDPALAADAEARGVVVRPFLTNNVMPVRPMPLRDLFPRASPSEMAILKRVKDYFVNGAIHTAPSLKARTGFFSCVGIHYGSHLIQRHVITLGVARYDGIFDILQVAKLASVSDEELRLPELQRAGR